MMQSGVDDRMAQPEHPGADRDEAVAILRRLEPALGQVQTDLGQVQRDVSQVQTELSQVQTDVKDLNTRVSRLEGQVSQLPGIWQMASLFTALLAAALGAGAVLVAIFG
jgi:septal ring factor EnvC (AmiA/AmiB activator)